MNFQKSIILTIIFALVNQLNLFSSDIVEVLPLTKNIVILHFKDGFAIYHKIGQARSNESVRVELLNTTEAAKISNYTVISSDDPNYNVAKTPTSVSRKTKGTEFTWMCQSWDNTKGCMNTEPDLVEEHWIYLTLPSPLVNGKIYTIQTSIAGNGNTWTLKYEETKLQSEAVHVNQIGYSPIAPQKFGYVYHWMGEAGSLDLASFANNSFNIIDLNTGSSVFAGQMKFRKSKTNAETGQTSETPNANFIGADVYECDFSSFAVPGEYVLSVDGVGCSFPFKIDADIYRQPFYTAIRGLYHNRSGIELKQAYTEFTRPAPHNPNITPGFSGKLKYTTSQFSDWKNEDNDPVDKPTIEAGDEGVINTWGWYQDAGDWDGYFTHLNIPALLMFTWEAAPANFCDNELNIPESGNGIPDILDEAGWLLRFCYRTRHEIMNKNFGTGGLGTRVFGDLWGSDETPQGTGRGSWQDNTRVWYVSGEDPFSTYKYAGLAAQMAFCLKTAGLSDTVDWKKEAVESYTWAKNNTKTGDESKHQLKYIRAYAAASLYRLTGLNEYQQQLKTDESGLTSFSKLSEEMRWAPYVYSGMPDSIAIDNDLLSRTRGAVLYTADDIVNTAEKRACRWGGDFSMPMLIGQATTPWVFEAIMGYKLVKNTDAEKARKYLGVTYTTADYFLGCNPLNTTWITGLGIRHPERIFHMDSWYNGKNEMAPGITPYGPWRVESYSDGKGVWDMKWPYKSIFPENIASWPGHERWFSNYPCPMNAEFTIHQNTIYNAAVFGFLSSTASNGFVPDRRPEIQFIGISANTNVKQNDSLQLSVSISDPDGNQDIYKVEYYNKWHKIGESFQSPFTIDWLVNQSGNLKLTACATDKNGMVGRTDTLSLMSAPNSVKSKLIEEVNFSVFPNPAYSKVTFTYNLQENSNLLLEICDVSGKKINTFQKNYATSGEYQFVWNGKDYDNHSVSPGIYFCHYYLNRNKVFLNDSIKLIFLKH